MQKALLNDFAIRSFRDTADQDYIAARLAYCSELVTQFHWSALQALEKYLKGILLLNRIRAVKVGHDLAAALERTKELPFSIEMSQSTKELVEHLDTFGRFRYLEASYFILGPKLLELDRAVWEVRRYCRVLDYEVPMPDGTSRAMLPLELAGIAQSAKAPHKHQILGGFLEKVLAKKKHPAREALVWQNAFFATRRRRRVRVRMAFHATNSPLTLNPDLLDEVLKYVFLPKDVITAYREEMAKRTAVS
jgi:HEPN domain-containing protein